MGVVIKRGGRRQVFSGAKIRRVIQKSAREAGISSAKTKELVKSVGEGVIKYYKNKRTVRATQIRRAILGRLERTAKSVASAWRRYDKKKRR
ncbi:MAG: ATP cone domain-containing protein [Nanoarchaeota archaeon]